MKVCHLTVVHQATDIRIYRKMCLSLAKAGYDVTLVAPETDDPVDSSVNYIPLPRAKSRLERWLKIRKGALQAVLRTQADLVHFHDPELMPVGHSLKKLGKLVIYDVHESTPEAVSERPYVPRLFRPLVRSFVHRLELRSDQEFTSIVAATPKIGRSFQNRRTRVIQNYPFRDELQLATPAPFHTRERSVAYVGGVSEVRGAVELVNAMALIPDITLYLAGPLSPTFKIHIDKVGIPNNVRLLGWLNRSEVASLLGRVRAGVITFLPAGNHLESQPNKMFEYMSAGLPIICSNFAYWEELLNYGSLPLGVSVDPRDPRAIADEIRRLVDNPGLAQTYGEAGYRAVREKYNWESQERILLSLYEEVSRLAR